MSRLRIFADNAPDVPHLTTSDATEVTDELATIGVGFEQWQVSEDVEPGDAPEKIIAAYRDDIDRIVYANGFRSVDVVSIAPNIENPAAVRAKFLEEHFHQEDEVRFFVAGSGLFTLHVDDKVYEILCEAGDLISVPDRMTHWFDMGPEPSFVAIRFFTQADGWIGHFTGTDIATRFPRYEVGAARE